MAKRVLRRRKPTPSWEPDPRIPDALVVPLDVAAKDARFPKVSPRILPETGFRWDSKKGRVRGLFTVMPDGLRIGWDNCGRCHEHISLCKCSGGIYHPRSVAWCLMRTKEWAGETNVPSMEQLFDPYHRYGKPSRLEAPTVAAKPLGAPRTAPEPQDGTGTPPARTRAQKPVMPTQEEMDERAEKMADALTEAVTKPRRVRRASVLSRRTANNDKKGRR